MEDWADRVAFNIYSYLCDAAVIPGPGSYRSSDASTYAAKDQSDRVFMNKIAAKLREAKMDGFELAIMNMGHGIPTDSKLAEIAVKMRKGQDVCDG